MGPELLSPAGNLETLKIAVQNGADAVYIAGKKFGARNYADNFSDEEIIEAINYCHIYGVKLYITINTIIYDDEIDKLITYVDFIHKNNVDAVIIQDLGVAHLIHEIFPNLDMHASTQMNIHNINGLKHLKNMGFKRVVLAREVPIEIIKKMKEEVDIELEVFVHGALCISYSGQCLLSYYACDRSGNRGKCAQLCRQEYSLYKDDKKIDIGDKYLLSPKDLCTVDVLEDLVKIGVDSFKIEGRMKSKEYVGLVTRAYRNKIDFNTVNDNDIYNMKKVFNRGFTLGHLYNKSGKDFINGFRPNHIGVLIGEVIGYRNRKVKIKLSDYVNQGDAIRFICNDEIGFYLNKIYKSDLLTNKGIGGDIIEVDCIKRIERGVKVYKTIDCKLNEEIRILSDNRKVCLDGEFIANENKIVFTVTDHINTEKIVLNDSVFEAKNVPTTENDIRSKLNKLGDEIYIFDNLKINIENNIFIPMTTINNLRREIIKLINDDRLKSNKTFIKSKYSFSSLNIPKTNDITFEVKNENQLIYLLKNTNYKIYIPDYILYKKYLNTNRVIYKMPRINMLNKSLENSLICEIGEFSNNCITDTYFNVVNSYSVYYLHSIGVKKVTLSYELDISNIEKLYSSYKDRYKELPNLEVVIYGRPDLMISRYCLLNTYFNSNKSCNICKKNSYYLVDKKGIKYPIRSENCSFKLLKPSNINLISNIDILKDIGISNFKIILDDEIECEIQKIIESLKEKITN